MKALLELVRRHRGGEAVGIYSVCSAHPLIDYRPEKAQHLSECPGDLPNLTDGRVVSIGESPLGFRHGPKTIVNGSTLVVTLLSNDAYTRQYDLDLLRELRSDGVAGRVVALTARAAEREGPDTIVLDAGVPTGGSLT